MKKLLVLLFTSFLMIQLITLPCVHAASLPFNATGQVLDRQGNPVHGATVMLYDGIYTVIGTATSDASGHFSFTGVVANNPGCKVKITFKDGSNTYETNLQNVLWYPTDTGTIRFNTNDTTLRGYPAPEYGYIWGVMQADGGNQRALGNGVVYASSGDLMYYTFTNNNQNKGTFLMRLPVGHYKVWGQYMENGMIFQSGKLLDLDVAGATNYLDITSTTVSVPLSAAAQNPQPPGMPTSDQVNVVSGYVTYKDGEPATDQVVTLYQATDDGASGYVKNGETATDENGFYQFYGVQVTADAPDNGVVYGSKNFNPTVEYTDPSGQACSESRTITLYNPNFISADPDADHRARNPVVNLTVPSSTKGWVTIKSDPPGARIYIDNRLVNGSDDHPAVTPYKAYLDPGRHMLKVSSPGYDDYLVTVSILENRETQDVVINLNKTQLPPWMPLVTIIVLGIGAVVALIVALLIGIVLLFNKR